MSRPRTTQTDVMAEARRITRERQQLAQEQAEAAAPVGVTWRCVLDGLQRRGYRESAVRSEVKWLRRTGLLRPVGTVRMPHSMRPLSVYAPADDDQPPVQPLPGAALAGAMRAWAAA